MIEVKVFKAQGRLVVTFEYDPELVNRIRAVPQSWWNANDRVWLVPPENLRSLVGQFPDAKYLGELEEETRFIKHSIAQAKEGATGSIEGISFPLRPYQVSGTLALATMDGGAILADDMGLGKTVQALALAHVLKEEHRQGADLRGRAMRVLVVCLASAKLTWLDHVKRVLPGWRGFIADSGKTVQHYFGSTWTDSFLGAEGFVGIVNYDRIWRKSVADALHGIKFDLLVLDEAHKIKNRKAKRSEAAVEAAGHSKYVLATTGTPVENRPAELFNILVTIGKFRRGDWWRYAKRYCDAKETIIWRKEPPDFKPRPRKVWDYTGKSNIEELGRMIAPYMIRRTKAEVLPELPPKQYDDWRVEVEKGDEYERNRKSAKAAHDAIEYTQNLFTMRRLLALAKVDFLTERLVDTPHSTLVFSSHVEPLERLGKQFLGSGAVLTGSVSTDERQQHMDAFQSGKLRFLFCSTAAMGQSVTLTAAQEVIFLDLPWTPAAKVQAEDRAHRIGQTKSLMVTTMTAVDSLDEALLSLHEEKSATASSLLGEAEMLKALKVTL